MQLVSSASSNSPFETIILKRMVCISHDDITLYWDLHFSEQGLYIFMSSELDLYLYDVRPLPFHVRVSRWFLVGFTFPCL